MEIKGLTRYRSKGKSRGFFYLFLLLCLSASCLLWGCVRLTGTAAAWKTNEAGETTGKQTGFDTDRLLHGGANDGKITV